MTQLIETALEGPTPLEVLAGEAERTGTDEKEAGDFLLIHRPGECDSTELAKIFRAARSGIEGMAFRVGKAEFDNFV